MELFWHYLDNIFTRLILLLVLGCCFNKCDWFLSENWENSGQTEKTPKNYFSGYQRNGNKYLVIGIINNNNFGPEQKKNTVEFKLIINN